MLGYYPNSNAKPRGSNLKAKVQKLVLCTFHTHLCRLNKLIQPYIQTNITHNTQQLHTHTHLLTKSQNILAHVYIYIYIYIYIKTKSTF